MHKTGHKNPPIASRWKKGQSGNPSGRPKNTKTFNQEFADILDAHIRVQNANGQLTFKHPIEVGLMSMIKKALTGSDSMFIRYFKVIEKFQSQVDEQERVANARDPVVDRELKALGLKLENGCVVVDKDSPEWPRSNDQ